MDAAGEVLTVLGPSDFGKSMVRRRVGVVFQAAALFDGTVLDNVLYEPRLRAGLARCCSRWWPSAAPRWSRWG